MVQAILDWKTRIQWFGLLAGPVAAGVCLVILPYEYRDVHGQVVALSTAARTTLAVMAWMSIWWVTEALDISVTSLLPLVLFPLLGARSMQDAAASYAHPLIFLFMGGFLLAIAMQHWKLDRRIALLTVRLAGTRPPNMVAGFMVATASLSAFVSNTATAAMMVPIAMSVMHLIRSKESARQTMDPRQLDNLGTALLLGIAFSASIGGIATVVGTPPNALLAAFVENSLPEAYRTDVTFDRWLLVGLPVVVLLLPTMWLMLTRFLFPLKREAIQGGRDLISQELRSLGPVTRGERFTLAIFLCTALSWILRPLLVKISWEMGGHHFVPLSGLTDPGIAMTGGLLLFLAPVDVHKRVFVLNWPAAKKLPWGILVLFGGGLSLAAAVKANGVAEFIGSQAVYFRDMPPWVMVLAIVVLINLLSEVTSDSATTATMLPVIAALAPGMGVHPYLLIFPATVAATCVFMMPVATPPNAIVFGSGEVRIGQMVRTGLWMTPIVVCLLTALGVWWFPLLFKSWMG